MNIENSYLSVGNEKETNGIASLCDLMVEHEASRYKNSFGQLENLKTVEDLLSEIRDRINSSNEQTESVEEVKSSIDKGTKFTFTLPRYRNQDDGVKKVDSKDMFERLGLKR